MYKELTAAQITSDAILILKSRNCYVRRHNNHATRGRQNNTEAGFPDIAGYNKGTGIAVYVEVKKIGDKLSTDQVKFLLNANQAGCNCMIATQGDRNDTVLIEFTEYFTNK